MAISPVSVTNAYQAASRIAGGAQQQTSAAASATSAAAANAGDFGALLQNALDGAAQTMKAGEIAAAQGAAGQADIVKVVNAVNAAELTLDTVVAVRDKVIGAYQDILKMPI